MSDLQQGDFDDAVESICDAAEQASAKAAEASRKFETLGRLGWYGKGVVYVLIGVLFIRIATEGDDSGEANHAGAVEAIVEQPLGIVLLVVLATALALYALWRAFTVVLPGDWTGRALLDRMGYAVSTAVYASLLLSTYGVIQNRGADPGKNEDRRVETLTKNVLEMTGGRTMVTIAGIVIVVIGIVFVKKGVTRSFLDGIRGDTGVDDTAIDVLGTIGWVARGVAMGIIGFFLMRAAWMFDASEAAGFDDSMRQTAGTSWGPFFIVAVGVGFVLYGLFAAWSARFRQLEGPTND